MLSALCDDLNTPKLLGILFENFENIKENNNLSKKIKSFFNKLLGLTFDSIKQKIEISADIKLLIEQREEARLNKNWDLADKLRNDLLMLGYKVQDNKIK